MKKKKTSPKIPGSYWIWFRMTKSFSYKLKSKWKVNNRANNKKLILSLAELHYFLYLLLLLLLLYYNYRYCYYIQIHYWMLHNGMVFFTTYISKCEFTICFTISFYFILLYSICPPFTFIQFIRSFSFHSFHTSIFFFSSFQFSNTEIDAFEYFIVTTECMCCAIYY